MNARTALDAATSSEVEVVLIQIDHPDLPTPIRLSTDPTERISTDPLIYGTRSTWLGANPATEPFLFMLMAADIPGDLEDAPAAATFVLENVSQDITAVLRSFIDRPSVQLAVVLASSPDVIEVEYRGMVMISSDGAVGEVSIQVSRAPIEDENVPMDRFTKDRFPGLFR
ncbi:hypothetical protein [Cognatiyoonia sp. IB215182]|uniref:hypothetical protein n=1 Tax=Cognatiyoonia sp. IB215182 TaxID=3097353 RepID=UPI002A16BC02|nr:hypothetical protein [Cognatiyoonia sp. IB215182]MDX8354362.1 hypothetical protein [Cognatiyoonia sp. IB215182]